MPEDNIVVVGASTGGAKALEDIFADLPSLECSIVIIQHMAEYLNKPFRRTLSELSDIPVKIATTGDELEKSTVYVAPSEIHLELVKNKTIRLFEREKVCFARPSVDVAMKSLRKKRNTLIMGIILSGPGNDGARGMIHLKNIGGVTIAQDEKTSSVYGMPKFALETGRVDFVMNPQEIRQKLIDAFGLHSASLGNRMERVSY